MQTVREMDLTHVMEYEELFKITFNRYPSRQDKKKVKKDTLIKKVLHINKMKNKFKGGL